MAEKKPVDMAAVEQALLKNINCGIAAVKYDENGERVFDYINDRFYEIFGYSAQEGRQLNLRITTTIQPEDRAQILPKIKQLQCDRKPIVMEYRSRKKDGSMIYLRCNCSVTDIPNVGSDVILTVLTDVTERALLSQQALESSQRLGAIMDNMLSGVALTVLRDGLPVHLLTNERYYELMGYTREEFRQVYPDNFLAVYPPDREKAVQLFRDAFQTLAPYQNEYRIIHKDGSIRNMFCRVNVMHIAGIEETVQLALVTDVTAQRRAEQKTRVLTEQMQSITEHLGCGITAAVTENDAQHLIFANDRFFELIGTTRKAYMEQERNNSSIILPEDREAVSRQVYAQLARGNIATVEYRVQLPDNKLRWLRTIVTRSKLFGMDTPVELSTYVDCTYKRQTEEQLKFLNQTAGRLLSQPDTSQGITQTLTEIMTFFGGQRAYLYEYIDEKNASVNTYEVCAAGVKSCKALMPTITEKEFPFWDELVGANGCICLNESQTGSAAEKQFFAQRQAHSLIAAPLRRDGVCIGAIGVDAPEKNNTHIDRLAALGDYMAVMLTRRDLISKADNEALQLHAVMDGMPGGFVRMQVMPDGNPIPLFFSEGFLALTGMEASVLQSLYGSNMLLGVHPSDLPLVRGALDTMVAGGQVRNLRFRLATADGYRRVTILGKSSRAKNGELYLNVYYTDADEQQTENVQQTLLDNLPCGAALYDYDGTNLRVIHINRYYWTLVGRPSTNYTDISPMNAVYPSDRRVLIDELNTSIEQKRDFAADARILFGEDSYRPFHLRGKLLQKEDGTYRVIVTYTPISEQVMNEQTMLPLALSALMETTSDIVFVKDKYLRYLCCSRSFFRLVGKSTDREVIGKTDNELFGRKYADLFIKHDRELLATGTPIIDLEEELPSGGSKGNWVKTSKYPLRDATGGIVGIYGVSYDITQQRQAQFELDTLLHAIPIGIVKYADDEVGTFSYINSAFIRALGYTEPQFREKFNNCFRDMIYQADRAQMAEEGVITFRIEPADGALRWFRCKRGHVKDEADRSWVYASVSDITDQKRTEMQLRTSEEEYRLATLQSDTTICRYYVADRSLHMTPYAIRRYSLPKVQENVPYSLVNSGQISANTAQAYISFYEGILCGQKHGQVEYQRMLRGKLVWLHSQYSTVFSETGEPVSAVISFHDITKQKEHETLSRLTESALSGEKDHVLFILAIAPSGIAVSYRRGASSEAYIPSLIGSLEELRNFASGTYVFPDDRATLAAMLYIDPDKTGGNDDSCDFRVQHTKDTVLWLNLYRTAISNDADDSTLTYYILRDITEQKRTEQSTVKHQPENRPRVFVRAFGYFDVFVDDKPVTFSGRQEKELLAILVDRRGGTLTSREAAAILWEDKPYDENVQANYRKIAMRLRKSLDAAGIGYLLLNKNGVRSIDTAAITCDYYEYLDGNPEFRKVFRGAYMTNYSWSEETLAALLTRAPQPDKEAE